MKVKSNNYLDLVLGSSRSRKAFTLIELLVVVIIIGVLAAVAVSAYKHATIKTQFTTVIPPTKSLAAAQEVFYLNYGEYAESKEELDLSVPDTAQTTVTLSDKRNYKFVKGHHTGVPGANYIVYQKNSKRFADNVHCEAEKNDEQAKWLCEKGLGGTPLTGSISGTNFLTYLLSGDAGTDKFLREDCPEGQYDNNGTCTKARAGYYAEDGEEKRCAEGSVSTYGASSCDLCSAGTYGDRTHNSCTPCLVGRYEDREGSTDCKYCPAGTGHTQRGATSIDACAPCPAGTRNPGMQNGCSPCSVGTYSEEGATTCKKCPAGTSNTITGASLADCTPCPAGTWQPGAGLGCMSCSEGYYSAAEGSASCTKCPTGQTSNADHTGCVPA